MARYEMHFEDRMTELTMDGEGKGRVQYDSHVCNKATKWSELPLTKTGIGTWRQGHQEPTFSHWFKMPWRLLSRDVN